MFPTLIAELAVCVVALSLSFRGPQPCSAIVRAKNLTDRFDMMTLYDDALQDRHLGAPGGRGLVEAAPFSGSTCVNE